MSLIRTAPVDTKGFDKDAWNKSDKAKQARAKSRHKTGTYSHRKYLSKRIVAIDGEGLNNDDGTHSYVLLAISDVRPVTNRKGISTYNILSYLHNNLSKDDINVVYGASYDFNCWIADLEEEQVRELYNSSYVSEPVIYEGFAIRWIKGKCFTITRDDKTITIYDVISFFQCPFVAACDSYLQESATYNARARATLVREKAKRGKFTWEEISGITDYNNLELELIVELVTELRLRLDKVNLRPRRWDGPGAIAASLFLREHVRDHMEQGAGEVERAARFAYAGGHFELVRYGNVKGKCYEYDINSAYPAALCEVPTLTGGTWTQTNTRTTGKFGLYRIRYVGRNPAIPSPVFCRAKNGTVSYPLNATTWVWSPEYDAIVEYCKQVKGATVTLLESWEFEPVSDYKPFAFIRELYAQRRLLKAAGDGAHVGIKLALNSMYGKLAQQTGWVPSDGKHSAKIPRYHELKWAGYATSWCRAQVIRAAITNLDAIIAFETDALFSSAPLPLDYGEDLGQWEVTVFDSLTYVQSGHYYATKSTGEEVVKCRGVDRGTITRQHVEDVLALPEGQRVLPAQLTRFYGAGIALVRGLAEYWRTWRTEPKYLQLMPTGKRLHGSCPHDNTEGLTPNIWHHTYCPIAGGLSHEFPIAWINPDDNMTELAELRETEREFEYE